MTKISRPRPKGRRVGLAGSTPDAIRARHEADLRVASAKSQVDEDRWRLERRIANERAQAEELDRQRVEADRVERARRREFWPLGDARNLVREGYSVTGTSQRTGWPEAMLSDVKPGEW